MAKHEQLFDPCLLLPFPTFAFSAFAFTPLQAMSKHEQLFDRSKVQIEATTRTSGESGGSGVQLDLQTEVQP
eukprot:scaffold14414_cov19-Tisochrysis_lutea.AAC.3